MKMRVTTAIALGAILSSLVLSLILQFALLGALNLRATAGELSLQPVLNAEARKTADGAAILLDTSRGAAAVQSKNLSVNAEDALAVVLHTDDTTAYRIGVGWVTLQERRRGPSNTNLSSAARAKPHETIVVLRGHPRWAGNITQMGFGIERANLADASSGAGAPIGPTTLHRAELIAANPAGAARLMWNAWFSERNLVITPTESANRLLPLAIWLTLVCIASVALTGAVLRRDPARCAVALRTCGLLLLALCTAATCFYSGWAGWTPPLTAGLSAALALIFIERPFSLPLQLVSAANVQMLSVNARQRAALSLGVALALFAVCVWLAPMVAIVLLVAATMLLIARYLSGTWAIRAAMLALAPILYVAAVAQHLLPATPALTPLTDPTASLAGVATHASGLPAIALGVVALHSTWPAAALATRWSTGALAGAVWALIAALAVLAIPKLAAQAQGNSTFVALFFPFVTCVVMAAWPRFRSVAATTQETRHVEQKTEADLSVQGLALLNGHADRVRNSLAEQKTASARTALRQMQQLAPAAHATRSAQLRIALAESDLQAARAAAENLNGVSHSSLEDADALLDLAQREGDHTQVIALAPTASTSVFNTRALSVARLLTQGPAAAVEVLGASPDPSLFAQEIAELYLLQDNVHFTQQSLAHSGIALNEPVGQAYIARLGMRAQGAVAHEKNITGLATWHPQVGAVHAAMGELLEQQGNYFGATTRYRHAMSLDSALWPLRYRVQRIDADVRG